MPLLHWLLSRQLQEKYHLRPNGGIFAIEGLFGGLNQWEWPSTTSPTKVVVIDRPEHDAAEGLLVDKVSLLTNDGLIVETDPKVVLVSIWAHYTGVGGFHLPTILFLHGLTHLVVGQVAILLGTFSSGSGAVGWAANLVGGGVDQGI
jgi:hypothetical protein